VEKEHVKTGGIAKVCWAKVSAVAKRQKGCEKIVPGQEK